MKIPRQVVCSSRKFRTFAAKYRIDGSKKEEKAANN